jgi:hypothetical protein
MLSEVLPRTKYLLKRARRNVGWKTFLRCVVDWWCLFLLLCFWQFDRALRYSSRRAKTMESLANFIEVCWLIIWLIALQHFRIHSTNYKGSLIESQIQH